ncbi:tRNA-dependent cyclodipeptide synthase [Streptomyces sp. NRRL F-5053]|uniref:tRNA-dependent cyclodipeptide synthase n=1 Tax=Streptomyces sp. NRRL F-5053 TaxID=1463854 RepID=UPI00099B4367|nr:tRNA-dependent cyclodipeptide synthase [Streptomyces sp. NRRL F-5053]
MNTSLAAVAGDHIVEPYSPNCERLLEAADHLLIGVSPGNSYFGIPTLTRILTWAHATFRRIDVIVPDRSLAANYRAQGYSEQVAHKKARTEISSVRRRVRRAWERSGIPEHEQRTHLLSELALLPAYEKLHRRVREALASDEQVFDVCQRATSRAVPVAEQTGEGTGSAAVPAPGPHLALDYLIDEMPFFIDTPSILGVPSSLVNYHMPVPFAGLLYTGDGPLRAPSHQGLILLRDRAAER